MLAAGSLSEAAFGLRRLLIDRISDFENDIGRIKIGHPGSNLKELESSGENGLNLFFYHIVYDGFPADGSADNPFFVRIHCLITAVGQETKKANSDTDRDISKGENELRLIGEVMAVLHAQPIFHLVNADEEEVATLQVVPHSVDMDTLNHIWSTQGSETPYRLSVAYEMSLAPIPYRLPAQASPLVAIPEMVAWGALQRDKSGETAGSIELTPRVAYLEVDTAAETWAPHVALVEEGTDATTALHYVFKVTAPSDPLAVQVAGKAGERIRLLWSVWRRRQDNSVDSWRSDIPDTETPLALIPSDSSGAPYHPDRLDPSDVDDRRLFRVRLPTEVTQQGTKSWQATLQVVRDSQREQPPGSGHLETTTVRGNMVLLYGGAA